MVTMLWVLFARLVLLLSGCTLPEDPSAPVPTNSAPSTATSTLPAPSESATAPSKDLAGCMGYVDASAPCAAENVRIVDCSRALSTARSLAVQATAPQPVQLERAMSTELTTPARTRALAAARDAKARCTGVTAANAAEAAALEDELRPPP